MHEIELGVEVGVQGARERCAAAGAGCDHDSRCRDLSVGVEHAVLEAVSAGALESVVTVPALHFVAHAASLPVNMSITGAKVRPCKPQVVGSSPTGGSKFRTQSIALRILCPRAHWLAAQKARFGGPFALLARCRTLNRSAPGAQLALCAAPLIKFGSQKPGARALKPAICDPNFGEWDRDRLGNGGGVGSVGSWVVGRGSWVVVCGLWSVVRGSGLGFALGQGSGSVGSWVVGRGSWVVGRGSWVVDRSRAAEHAACEDHPGRGRVTKRVG